MKEIIPYVTAAILAYLLGAIPFGFLIARSRGVDIRKVGSGNIGATNVFRTLGKRFGTMTFILDIGKGVGAVTLIPLLMKAGDDVPLRLTCAIAVVAGHNWPVWLKFKGGKGVATSAGIMIGLAPFSVLIGFGVWISILILSRYVSLASITAAVTLAISTWMIEGKEGWLLPSAITLLSLLVILRHKSNIVRLLTGTENRFSFKRNKL